MMPIEGINILIEQLKNRTYQISPYHEFKVYEPKERLIQTSAFKDKVVQHSLCDNVLLPRLQRIFLYDNCAGQIGKGTLFGLDRLSFHLQHFYSRYKRNGYILKCDISKFFYNISHEQMKDIADYYFGYDPDICWLCRLFIDSTDGKGLPLGNQINQGLALLYLDGMDNLIVHELGIEYYGRYMDDFYLIHPSKEYLKHCLDAITEYLKTLDLTLNGKTQIFPIKNGLNYLGFHTYLLPNGKVIRKVKNENKRNAMKKYRRFARIVAEGKADRNCLEESFGAYQNHISHGDCDGVYKKIKRDIKEILKRGDQ
jgi:hypothetical protein